MGNFPINTTYHGHTLGLFISRFFKGDCKYDTIRYDSVYLTCSKKLTGSQLTPPHGTNKKLKCETKNKTMTAKFSQIA